METDFQDTPESHREDMHPIMNNNDSDSNRDNNKINETPIYKTANETISTTERERRSQLKQNSK
jgi:hypothetical protein